MQSVSMWPKKFTWLIYLGGKLCSIQNSLVSRKRKWNWYGEERQKFIHSYFKAHFHQFFLVTYCVDKEEFSVENCNISAVLANFFTKPSQESLFFTSQGSHYGMGARPHPARLCSTSKEGARWKPCLLRNPKNQAKGNLRTNRNWESNRECR